MLAVALCLACSGGSSEKVVGSTALEAARPPAGATSTGSSSRPRPPGPGRGHTIAASIGSLESMDVGDFNKDGRIDVVTGDHRGDGLRTLVFENVASGASWKIHVAHSGCDTHPGAQAADLDGDGDLDVWLWRNDGH